MRGGLEGWGGAGEWEWGRLASPRGGPCCPLGPVEALSPRIRQMPTTFETPHVANSHFLGGSELVRVSPWGLHVLGSTWLGEGSCPADCQAWLFLGL